MQRSVGWSGILIIQVWFIGQARYMHTLPLILYSFSAIVTGLMVLTFPETFNTKLPDTVEDALNVGRSKRKPIPSVDNGF